MLTAWAIYSIIVSALVASAALGFEKVCRLLHRPARWVWASAMLGAGGLMALPVLKTPGGGLDGAGGVSAEAGSELAALGPLTVMASGGASAGAADTGEPALSLPAVSWRVPSDSWLSMADAPLLILWCLVSVLLIGRLLGAWFALRRKAGNWRPTDLDGERVWISRGMGPAAVGLGGGRIVVPSWLPSAPQRIRSLVLAHEGEHVRARDPALLTAGSLFVALLPWNPALWFALSRMRIAVEVDCDERVLRRWPQARRSYGTLLLELGVGRCSPDLLAPTFLGWGPGSLKRRIEMMTRTRTKRPLRRSLPFAAVAGTVLAAACMVPTPEEERSGVTDPDATAGEAPEAVQEAQEQEDVEAPESGEPTAQEGPVDATADELSGEPRFTPFTDAPEVVNREELVEALDAAYPPALRDAGVGGTTMVHFLIDEEGTVRETRIAEPSDHDALDRAALDVAQRFQFSPARYDDETTPVWIQIPITFQEGASQTDSSGW